MSDHRDTAITSPDFYLQAFVHFALYSHFVVQSFPHLNKTFSVYFTDLILLLLPPSFFLPILSRIDPLSQSLFSPQVIKNKLRTSLLTSFFVSALFKIVFLSVLYLKLFSKILFYTGALTQYLFG